MEFLRGEEAHVDLRKVTDYLLSREHPVGRHKARFFEAAGFEQNMAEELRQGLLEVARTGQVVDVTETQHGTKYVVDGEVFSPSGERVQLRTVWIRESGPAGPRLVTAYPRGGEEGVRGT